MLPCELATMDVSTWEDRASLLGRAGAGVYVAESKCKY